jgi:hypothetical protein
MRRFDRGVACRLPGAPRSRRVGDAGARCRTVRASRDDSHAPVSFVRNADDVAASPPRRRTVAVAAMRCAAALAFVAAWYAGASFAEPPAAAVARAADAPDAPMQRLYREGVLPDGQNLVGTRPEDTSLAGRDAACVRCHRRSGLGTAEGKLIIPPISGDHPYENRSLNLEDMDQAHASNVGRVRPPHTPASLARAIRDGIGADGQPLSAVMPRYALDDETLARLGRYLKSLDPGPVPGVSADTLKFATIVTPDADPAARDGMLAVMRRFFDDRNHIIAGQARPLKHRHGVVFRVTRKWTLDVWELTGPADTWERQLDAKLDANPVFAVVSGIAGRTWAPVHRFCERREVPCLFPNIDLPVVNEQEFYPMYFSRGVLLEADLARRALAQAAGRGALRRVVQVYRRDDVGEAAAAGLRAAAALPGVEIVDRVLSATPAAGDVASAVETTGAGDALVLWLRRADVAALPPSPPQAAVVVVSGLMSGMESAPVPASWRASTVLAYPAELPDKRSVPMTHPLGWMRIKGIAVNSEWTQVHTYLACQILSETLGEMLDSFVRDYLIERAEVMLSHRRFNAYYPRLSLAQDQRFASKGGYLVRFAEPQGTKVVADGDWVVP